MRLYTLDEVATLLQVSKETVYRLVKAGQLPGSKVGRAWRFAAEDIEKFLTSQEHRVCPSQSPSYFEVPKIVSAVPEFALSCEQAGAIGEESAPRQKHKNELGNFFTRRLRILLAEDNVINQRLTRALLEKYGHEVVVVDNGRDAVEQIKTHKFDVVLMDIQMPIMTGVEATKAIRNLPQHSNIPIIAVTSNIKEGDRERFLAEGLDDYVPKPIRRSDLLSSIKRATSVLCNVLIVEDNAGDFELAKYELLNGHRYGIRFGDVSWAKSIAEAEDMIAERSPDVILLDSSLPDASGLSGLERMKATGCLAPILLLTGMSDDEVAIAALHAGAQDYLVKGQAGDLHRAIRYALERAETQTELIEAKKDALSANAAKGAFLANMSHEIRTPLTAIIGFSEALAENNLTPEDRVQSARAVLRNGRYLLEIINDILDFSKIEAGKVDVELLDFSPVALVKEVTDIMKLKALDRGIELKTSCEFPLPKTIHSDPVRIKQILLNLIGNAVKFTSQGQVRIELSADIAGERLFVKSQTPVSECQTNRSVGYFSPLRKRMYLRLEGLAAQASG